MYIYEVQYNFVNKKADMYGYKSGRHIPNNI